MSIRLSGMTDEQVEIQRYQDCYHGRLFEPADPKKKKRMYPWGTRWDSAGRPVPEKRWMPIYQAAIAKEIVGAHDAMLFGEDAFPELKITTNTADIYSDLTIDPDIENPDDARLIAANNELQKLLEELLDQIDIYDVMQKSSTDALVQGTIPVLYSAYGSELCAEVLDSKWVKLYNDDEKRPKTITRMVEQYIIEKEVSAGRFENWIYRREVDETQWREWEKKLDDREQVPKLADSDLKTEPYIHNLGLCPVVEVYKPDRRSIFADEITDNIYGFIKYDNDIKASLRRQLDPQPYMLIDDGDEGDFGEPEGLSDDKPLEPPTIWPWRAKSVGSLSTQGSHEIAVQDRDNMKAEILKSCFIIEIPDKNQQSGKAIGLRLAPMKSAVSKFRRSMGRGGLVKTCQMLIAMVIRLEELGQQITLGPDIKIPQKVPGARFTVALDWGAIIPLDEDDKAKALQNAILLKNEKMGSRKRAITYIAAAFGIEDVDAEIILIDSEQAEEAELIAAAQNQLFGVMNNVQNDI